MNDEQAREMTKEELIAELRRVQNLLNKAAFQNDELNVQLDRAEMANAKLSRPCWNCDAPPEDPDRPHTTEPQEREGQER